ncbi:hypothetical protein BGX28_003802 [Mortierella sp. GBA30]|nr:hypothetical protein BGX28_003802 [Mortierella sp. GBA30]
MAYSQKEQRTRSFNERLQGKAFRSSQYVLNHTYTQVSQAFPANSHSLTKMKISLSVAAIGAIIFASNAETVRVCRAGWRDDKVCAYECNNGNPVDGERCNDFMNKLISNNSTCWGDCAPNSGYQFWCLRATLFPDDCNIRYWSN